MKNLSYILLSLVYTVFLWEQSPFLLQREELHEHLCNHPILINQLFGRQISQRF